jgi:hypothetical protein
MSITMHPPLYGAYTSLWSGLNEIITVEDGGRYVIPVILPTSLFWNIRS